MTYIKILLDRSGSMASCREGTVAGFNQYLRDQQAMPEDGTALSLVWDEKVPRKRAAARSKDGLHALSILLGGCTDMP